ncbi:MAG: hypothetical protein ACOX42_00565 [Clostridia bacterium]|nr:hypothetical protein [Clostridiales bacterium]
MSDNEKLHELMAQMYSKMEKGFNELRTDVGGLKADVNALKDETRKTNLTIEYDIKPKIDALFDGYKQNADTLDRIEAEVIKHEEFIIKRIK